MSDKLNINRNRQFDGARPSQMQTPRVDVNELASYHCPNCLNSAFNSVFQYLEIPAILANNNGQAGTLKVESMLCIRCGGVFTQKQLKKLSKIEREEARLRIEMQHQQSAREEKVEEVLENIKSLNGDII